MRRYVNILFVSLFALVSILLLFPDQSSGESYRERRLLGRRYILYGVVDLSYERHWFGSGNSSSGPATSEFIHRYTLGLKGFVVDPRLMNFDVSGTFAQSIQHNLGNNYTLKGANVYITLMETLPPRWLPYQYFIPHPILLRFSKYTGFYELTDYGVSLQYFPGRKQNSSASAIPVPVTHFDYDRYDYSFGNYKTVSTLYSLRSEAVGKTYNYQFLYERLDETGSVVQRRDLIELLPTYRFFNEQTKGYLQIQNILKWEKLDDRRDIVLSSSVNWSRPMGRDFLQVTGGVGYLNTSINGEGSTSYNTAAAVSYGKFISPRLSNTVSLGMAFENTTDRTSHSEVLEDTVTADLSRLFRGTGRAFLGNSSGGAQYGTEINLYTKTRIYVNPGYAFTSSSLDEGRTNTHIFNLNASGPIIGNLSFYTYARYTIKDVSETDNPYTEDSLSFSGNLYWLLPKTSLTLGGAYSEVTKKDGLTDRTSVTSLNASMLRILGRNAFLTVLGTWTRDSSRQETLEVRPRLQWNLRETSLSAEYNYRRLSGPNRLASTDHRLFIRLIRAFSRNLRF